MGSDVDHSGDLTLEEFTNAMHSNPALQGALRGLNLDIEDIGELFRVVDWDGSGAITMEEFVSACSKLHSNVASAWDALATHAGVRGLERKICQLDQKVSKLDGRF